MKKLLILITMAVMTTTMFAKPENGKKVFPFPYEKMNLENGLKVIMIPFDSPGLVSYYSIVRTGSRDEWEPGKSGFAHFFEHMMFHGTDKYPAKVYDSIVTSIGADANAYTSDDQTVYHLNFAAEDLPRVMELESDRFQNLKYQEADFQTESGAVYGEYRKGITNPWENAIEAIRDMAFDKHTYKHTTIGFERDIKDMPNQYQYSISFFNRYYRPSNVVIVIVGDFKPADAKQLVSKYYSAWKPGYVAPKIEAEPKQTAPRKKEISYSGKSLPLILLGYKNDAFSTTNKEYLATYHIADLLFGETSELYKKLVIKDQKVKSISANPGPSRDPYMFEIYVEVMNENDIPSVLAEINNTIESAKSTLVDIEKLNKLKQRNKYGFLMGLDNPNAIASMLPQFIIMTGDIEVVDDFYNGLDEVTPKNIQDAVIKYFTSSNENLVILKGSK